MSKQSKNPAAENQALTPNKRKLRSSMAKNLIGAMVLLLVLLGLIVSTIGYVSFTEAFQKEYATSTFHMASTAATLVNGDHLDAYLAGELTEEYQQTKERLDVYCKTMSVSLIYVIQVDRSDYGRFVSIFNPVDNSVDNSSYTEWELGHKRDTTNDEYRQKYQAIYEKAVPYETVYRIRNADGQHDHITTMVPVTGSDGSVTAILCMQRPVRELREARRPYLIRIAVSTVLLALISSVLAAFFLRRQFVFPIRKVSAEATRFADENTKGTPLGKISKFREISDLAGSIDKMETDMVTYMENLTSVTAERERIGAELSLASKIQESSIPTKFPAFPERKDFDIYASMTPAKEVGGDFYNFFLVDDDHLALVIGDVSGKGVPAALMMMVTNILISDRIILGGTPGEVLHSVNNAICDHNEADMFVTVWVGILELSTGKLSFANAGHDDAALCPKDGSFELQKTKRNLVIGVMPGVPYRDHSLQLSSGDRLFLYTDGVPEATDADNQLFSLNRMLESLNAHKKESPQEILEGIHADVNAFVGDAPQFDDLTMLCLELK